MPVAVRLIEVLAIITLVATVAAGAAIVIFMEKSLCFLVMITDPLVYVINVVLGLLRYILLKIIYKLTYLMQKVTSALWDKSGGPMSSKCGK